MPNAQYFLYTYLLITTIAIQKTYAVHFITSPFIKGIKHKKINKKNKFSQVTPSIRYIHIVLPITNKNKKHLLLLVTN